MTAADFPDRCAKCGSRNHKEWDCSKKGPWVPSPEDIAAVRLEKAKAASDVKAKAEERERSERAEAEAREKNKLAPARWRGGPQICAAENLPAFADERAMAKFNDENCPGASLPRRWRCTKCGMWHESAEPTRMPSAPFLRRETKAAVRARAEALTTRFRAIAELPVQAAPAKPAAPRPAPRPKVKETLF